MSFHELSDNLIAILPLIIRLLILLSRDRRPKRNINMAHFLYSLIVAVIVYGVGCLFDKTPNNRYAGFAGLATFVLVFLGFAFVG